MPSSPNASSINATISVNPQGLISYTFSDVFDMDIALGATNQSPIVLSGLGSTSGVNDRIQLQNSSGDTIFGDVGNDTFVISPLQTSLNGDVIHGGNGFNTIAINASGTDVDLTGVSAGTPASSGIEAVVGKMGLTGQSVDLSLANLLASDFTDGNASHGPAFTALLGRDGVVNFSTPSTFQLVGIVDGAGDGFSATGTALTGSALSTLQSEVTSITGVEGSLAYLYTGAANGSLAWVQALWAYLPSNLDGYVFSSGSKYYTVWTDGTIHQTNTNGTQLTPAPQPAPVSEPGTGLGVISTFQASTAGYATITQNANGFTTLTLGAKPETKYAHVSYKNSVAGTIVHAVGDGGTDLFNLQGSGGGNIIYGGAQGDIFDLGSSPALIDLLQGQGGFNIVHAAATGSDVNLTSSNSSAGGTAADIQAVVGGTGGSNTVEVNLTALKTTLTKTSVFEFLAGPSSTLTLFGGPSSAYVWHEIAVLPPGTTGATGETPLTNGSQLDGLYGNGSLHLAETMTGYEFVMYKNNLPARYDTIWTNATVATTDPSHVILNPALMAQAAAFMSGTTGGTTGGTTTTTTTTNTLNLAAGH